MPATLPPGTELPSTLMGAGWRGRAASHAEEIAEGRIWRPYGVRSAFAPLTAVLLTWPGDELAYDAPPNDMLMARRPDLSRMRVQAESIAAAYAAAGAAVHWIRPTANAPPNLVFACDLFFMTPEGAILGRMAAEQRAAEPRLCAAALAEVGVALLATPRGRATFEGADALWLAPDRVLVGVGKRTNEAGFQLVRAVLAEMGVTALAVDLPSTVQHLLGCVNPIDHDLVVSLGATDGAKGAFAEAGYRCLEFGSDDETSGGRSLNFVTTGPRRILMPGPSPRTRARLEAEGVVCQELDVGEYIAAEGALGCLTGVLSRA